MGRKVIQITDKGLVLCDDGTMWRQVALIGTGIEWARLPDIPQDGFSGNPKKDVKMPEPVFVDGV